MKRILALTLSIMSLGVFASSGQVYAENSTIPTKSDFSANSSEPQVRIRIGQNRRRYGRFRTVRQTRFVRYGRRTYRETLLVRYYPNGRTETTLLSRERVS